MKHNRFRLMTGGVGALLLCAAWSAHAQDNAIGPAQLKDFTLQGRTTQPARPQPEAAAPVVNAPPPVTPRPATAAPTRPQPQAETRPAQRESAPPPTSASPAPAPSPQPVGEPAPQLPEPVAPAPQGAPTSTVEESEGGFSWLYLLPVAALALLGLAFLARRRRREGEEEAFVPVVSPAPALTPLLSAREKAVRPEPVPRPWLELGLKAERATATLDETVVQFELEIANTGKAAASNLRIDVKMFNAGKQQDKEIGAFFRVAGRESSKCILPGIAAGTTGVIHGQVTMKRDDMRAVRLDEKLLFVPMIAVNALYDWGEGETGQTSKSYVVGRELEQPSEKMGAFRVDLGPRVWRTIGQRQHKLARQV